MFHFIVIYFLAVETWVLIYSLISICSLFRLCLPEDLMLVEIPLFYLRVMWMRLILLMEIRASLGLQLLIVLPHMEVHCSLPVLL